MPMESSNEGTTRGTPGGEDYVEPSGGQARILLTMSRDEADRRLRKQISRGRELLAAPITAEECARAGSMTVDFSESWQGDNLAAAQVQMRKWSDYNRELLNSMADGDTLAREYSLTGRPKLLVNPSFDSLVSDYRQTVKTYIGRLESVVDRLELFAEPPALAHSAQREPGQSMASSNRIFIVHGLNDAAKYELKNYVQNTLQLGEPVILHEQPSMGRTIIEKFEEHAKDVDVVFVLLTPDDKLCSPSDTAIVKQRARQNVIFELGYFYGKLQRGSGRVLLLYQGDLDLPSDISGIVYIDISNSVEAAGERIRRELATWL